MITCVYLQIITITDYDYPRSVTSMQNQNYGSDDIIVIHVFQVSIWIQSRFN